MDDNYDLINEKLDICFQYLILVFNKESDDLIKIREIMRDIFEFLIYETNNKNIIKKYINLLLNYIDDYNIDIIYLITSILTENLYNFFYYYNLKENIKNIDNSLNILKYFIKHLINNNKTHIIKILFKLNFFKNKILKVYKYSNLTEYYNEDTILNININNNLYYYTKNSIFSILYLIYILYKLDNIHLIPDKILNFFKKFILVDEYTIYIKGKGVLDCEFYTNYNFIQLKFYIEIMLNLLDLKFQWIRLVVLDKK